MEPPVELELVAVLDCLEGALRFVEVKIMGSDLWLRPSQLMSTIQNPKKSWLATKPACSLEA